VPNDHGEQTPTDAQAALLSHPDPAVRFNAGLDRVKAGDTAGVPALIEAFTHDSGVVRLFHAGKALIELGTPAVPALEAALADPRARVRVDAAVVLGRIDPSRREGLLPLVVAALGEEDRAASGDALTFLGEAAARTTIPVLVDRLEAPATLDDPEAWGADRRVSLAALLGHFAAPRGGMETAEPVALAALTRALRAGAPSVRWAAARALGQLAGAAKPTAAALAAVARDEGEVETVRVEAAYALAVMGEPATETTPTLLAMLESRDAWSRLFAARILGEGGEPVVPSGDRARPRDLWTTAASAWRQARRIEAPGPVVAGLAAALGDPDANVARNAAYALSRYGERAAAAIPALVAALARAEVGPVVAEALARVGDEAVPALAACLPEEEEDARRALAAYALQLLDSPAARSALAEADGDRENPGFTPTMEHFFAAVPVAWSAEKRSAFETLYHAALARSDGGVPTIEYTLPYPRHEFLRYLVEKKRLLLHGTDRRDLEVLQPLRWSIGSLDHLNVSGVYADRDPVRPIYFAVVDRKRAGGFSNGFFDLDENGRIMEGEAPTCELRFYRLALPVTGLARDPWRSGCVYILPEESFVYWKEWTSRTPVRALMRLPVAPEDLPLRDQVWGVDWRQPVDSRVHPDRPFPFLADTQATPIRAPRSLCRR
jgi:HEAT repeat protein